MVCYATDNGSPFIQILKYFSTNIDGMVSNGENVIVVDYSTNVYIYYNMLLFWGNGMTDEHISWETGCQ